MYKIGQNSLFVQFQPKTAPPSPLSALFFFALKLDKMIVVGENTDSGWFWLIFGLLKDYI